MTADGKRCRTGGGILWNILKVRQPAAYREIMKKTKDFEKQFKQENVGRALAQNKENSSRETACNLTNGTSVSVLEDSQLLPQTREEQFSTEGT
ncbi:Putative carnobacteriocin-B2 immunity [Gossypium arboreum]|nr:Putative carnobacteriocin-B2 immunity [Gossypium arboreum]